MNLMGIGTPELLVILLVAFLVLGPSKAIDGVRTVGKFVRDLRQTLNQVMAAAGLEQLDERTGRKGLPRIDLDQPGRSNVGPKEPPQETAEEGPSKKENE